MVLIAGSSVAAPWFAALRRTLRSAAAWRNGAIWRAPGSPPPWTLGWTAGSVRAVDAPRVIRVVVGEDHPIFRDGIVHVLEDSGFEVVGTAGDAPELLRRIRAHRPDVVVADIQMPPDHTDDGLRAVLEARASQPGLGVLVLSQFLEDRYVLE